MSTSGFLFALSGAWIVAILQNQSNLWTCIKSEAQCSEDERRLRERGLLKRLLLEFLFFLPLSTILVCLLSHAFFLLDNLERMLSSSPVAKITFATILGIVSYILFESTKRITLNRVGRIFNQDRDSIIPSPEKLRIETISKNDEQKKLGDVIFVHGMGGDLYQTWTADEQTSHWGTWLADECQNLRFWTLAYPADPMIWGEGAMPLQDRAKNVLALLRTEGIGERPLCFITHSLGGLLIKQMLQIAISGGTDEFSQMMKETKGIVFISTPHTGSDMATILYNIARIVTTDVIANLRANGAELRTLNEWYINHIDALNIKNVVFFEKYNTKGVRIVDEASGSLIIRGVTPLPIDADHIQISKPKSRNDLVYKETRRFLRAILPKE